MHAFEAAGGLRPAAPAAIRRPGDEPPTADLSRTLRGLLHRCRTVAGVLEETGLGHRISDFTYTAKHCQSVLTQLQERDQAALAPAVPELTRCLEEVRPVLTKLASTLDGWAADDVATANLVNPRSRAPVERLFASLQVAVANVQRAHQRAASDGGLAGAGSGRGGAAAVDGSSGRLPPPGTATTAARAYSMALPPASSAVPPGAPGSHYGSLPSAAALAAPPASDAVRRDTSASSDSPYAPVAGGLGATFSAADAIADADGLRFWTSMFGGNTHSVPWTLFLQRLQLHLRRELSSSLSDHLKLALDNSGCHTVTAFKFSEMLQGFGPTVKGAVDRLHAAMTETWFHGFLTYEEAVEVLRGSGTPGTFLIRFSQSSACAFALAFVAPDGGIQQVLIESVPGRGFVTGDRAYSSLAEVVYHNRHVLTTPAPNSLRSCKYFHGFLSFPETTDLLAPTPPGTFLLRFSRSQPGSLVVAFVNAHGAVQQSLIHSQPSSGGYYLGDKLYPSLDAIVEANSDKLVAPLHTSQHQSATEMPVPPTVPALPPRAERAVTDDPPTMVAAAAASSTTDDTPYNYMPDNTEPSHAGGGGGGGGGSSATMALLTPSRVMATAAAPGDASVQAALPAHFSRDASFARGLPLRADAHRVRGVSAGANLSPVPEATPPAAGVAGDAQPPAPHAAPSAAEAALFRGSGLTASAPAPPPPPAPAPGMPTAAAPGGRGYGLFADPQLVSPGAHFLPATAPTPAAPTTAAPAAAVPHTYTAAVSSAPAPTTTPPSALPSQSPPDAVSQLLAGTAPAPSHYRPGVAAAPSPANSGSSMYSMLDAPGASAGSLPAVPSSQEADPAPLSS